MINVLEINNICIACDACRYICPEKCIISDGKQYHIENWACTNCELCIQVCPVDAIKNKDSQVS